MIRAIIAPCSLERFAAETWQVEPRLFRPERPSRFETLFTRTSFEELLCLSSLRPEQGDVSLLGQEGVFNEHFPREILARGPLDDPSRVLRFHRSYARGAALWVSRADRRDRALHELAKEAADETRFPIRVDASLWPAGTHARVPSSEGTDRFFLMIEGQATIQRATPDVALESLNAGDVLYLPPESLVELKTAAPTLLLDVRVEAFSFQDLILRAVERHAVDEESLRRALRPGYSAPSHNDLAAFRAIVSALPEKLDLERARIAQVGTLHRVLPPNPSGWTRQIDILPRVDPKSEVRIVSRFRVLEVAGSVYVQGPAHTERFPKGSATAVRQVCEAEWLRVEELDDRLTPEAKVALVRRFVESGWLEVRPRQTVPPGEATP